MHNLFKYKALIICFVLLIVTGYYLGTKNIIGTLVHSDLTGSNNEYSTVFDNKKLKIDDPLLIEIQKNLNEKFVSWKATYTPPTEDDFEQAIVKGYVDAYKDPYTQYFSPEEAKTFKENVTGSFGGVGMEVGLRDGLVTVIAPLKDSPAMKAGVKSGDIIMKVEGKDIYEESLSIDQVVGHIRGSIGTEVKITILPKGSKDIKDAKEVKITRQEIKVPTIDTKIENGVFVISLYSFTAESPELFKQAILKFADSKTDKLIVDLRGNPGGYLEAAVQIASFFLPEGKVIVSEKSANQNQTKDHRSIGYNVFNSKLKLYVLIDEGSASASEILAGALQDHDIATIYGQKSYGKGSVQEFVDLKNGGSLKVTVAKWFTPNGRNITEDKIVPDVEVKRTDKTTSESELTNIIKMINSNK
ncbi:MAG: Peptidase [Patescibacteria group bacterium]|nr:Peptidase [Patescibacteria group bacterium]